MNTLFLTTYVCYKVNVGSNYRELCHMKNLQQLSMESKSRLYK